MCPLLLSLIGQKPKGRSAFLGLLRRRGAFVGSDHGSVARATRATTSPPKIRLFRVFTHLLVPVYKFFTREAKNLFADLHRTSNFGGCCQPRRHVHYVAVARWAGVVLVFFFFSALHSKVLDFTPPSAKFLVCGEIKMTLQGVMYRFFY